MSKEKKEALKIESKYRKDLSTADARDVYNDCTILSHICQDEN